jgi:hypothetical protein
VLIREGRGAKGVRGGVKRQYKGWRSTRGGEEGYMGTYLGCLEIDHNPEEINFSSCFLSSFSDLHCDFSIISNANEVSVGSSGDEWCRVDRKKEGDIRESAMISNSNPPAQIPTPIKSLRPSAGWAALGIVLTKIAGRETMVIHVA